MRPSDNWVRPIADGACEVYWVGQVGASLNADWLPKDEQVVRCQFGCSMSGEIERAILLGHAKALTLQARQVHDDATRMSDATDGLRLTGLAHLLEREAARLLSRAASSRYDRVARTAAAAEGSGEDGQIS
jgi:hypothetical protein